MTERPKPKCTICKVNEAQREYGKAGNPRCKPCDSQYRNELRARKKRGDYRPRNRKHRLTDLPNVQEDSDVRLSGKWLRTKLTKNPPEVAS